MQELTSSVEMARHVEAPLNHFRHSLGGPQFCAVAIGNGSLKQDPDQPTLLASRQSSRTTRRESHLAMTELAAQPIRRATSFKENFAPSSFSARLRRSESSSAEPFGRMGTSYCQEASLLHYFM
jgi:hypothetical protein